MLRTESCIVKKMTKRNNISDEKLMAYADGELPAAERVAVEAALETDRDLVRRLRVFTNTSVQRLGRLYDEPMHQPIPGELLAVIKNTGRRPSVEQTQSFTRQPQVYTHRKSGSVRSSSLRSFLQNLPAFGDWQASPALALSAALLIGSLGGWLIARQGVVNNPAASGEVVASRAGSQAQGRWEQIFSASGQRVLTQTPSGKVVHLAQSPGGTVTVRPQFTFRSTDGRVCRQYEIGAVQPGGQTGHRAQQTGQSDGSGAAGSGYVGVACRTDTGQWQVLLQMAANVNHNKMNDQQTIPAGSDRSLADRFVDELIAGDVLGPAEEKALIEGGWGGPK